MKKWITAGCIAAIILMLIFYIGNQMNAEKDTIDNQTQQDSNHVDVESDRESEKEAGYHPALELLHAGKMDGIPFAIGTKSIEIIEEWGEPDQTADFLGGLLLAYEDVFLLTDGVVLDDGLTYGTLVGILYIGQNPVYGIQIGMTREEVEAVLGAPNHTYISENSELYADQQTIVRYRAGDYTADIEISHENGTVQSISIWEADKSE